jgi:hypothetical protein
MESLPPVLLNFVRCHGKYFDGRLPQQLQTALIKFERKYWGVRTRIEPGSPVFDDKVASAALADTCAIVMIMAHDEGIERSLCIFEGYDTLPALRAPALSALSQAMAECTDVTDSLNAYAVPASDERPAKYATLIAADALYLTLNYGRADITYERPLEILKALPGVALIDQFFELRRHIRSLCQWITHVCSSETCWPSDASVEDEIATLTSEKMKLIAEAIHPEMRRFIRENLQVFKNTI